MNHTLSPSLTSCPECPQWEIACQSDAEKAAVEARHAHAKHGAPMPVQELKATGWQPQAVEAVRTMAATGRDFALHEALREQGVPDPPNHRTALGRFAVLVHDLQAAHPVGFRQSERGGTKRSAVAVWNRDVRRCTDMRCRRRAGVV